MAILLPDRRADPTRARELVVARPSDVPFWREYRERGLKPVGGGGNQTNQWLEPLWTNGADGPQVVSAAAETALLSSTSGQPWFYPGFWGNPTAKGKVVEIRAAGVLQTTTGPPTYTFFVRLGSTQNVISGTIIAQSAGIVTVASQGAGTYWDLECTILCNTPGIGTGAATLTSWGKVSSPNGFASPFSYSMEVSTPPNATWTTTLDGSLSQYLMLSMNPGTSSASNNATLKTLRVWATTL